MSERRRGRQAGHAARVAAPPAASAVRAGLEGGRYQPLTAADQARINDAVMHVLEHIGMGDPIPILRERALERGCRINEHGRLCYPRALVEDVIANTPKTIHFLGREPRHDLEIGGSRVHCYGGGEAVNMLDPGASKYRPSTLADVYDAARLVDRMDNIHAFSRLVVATEIADQRVCDINTAYASVAGTAKHVALTFNDARHVQPTLDMLQMIAGGERPGRGRRSRRPSGPRVSRRRCGSATGSRAETWAREDEHAGGDAEHPQSVPRAEGGPRPLQFPFQEGAGRFPQGGVPEEERDRGGVELQRREPLRAASAKASCEVTTAYFGRCSAIQHRA